MEFVALVACKSALTILMLGRRALASQRVSIRLPATRVDSSTVCFATCVCLSACDTALVARPAHTPLRDLADTVVAYALAQLAADDTDRLGGSKIHPRR